MKKRTLESLIIKIDTVVEQSPTSSNEEVARELIRLINVYGADKFDAGLSVADMDEKPALVAAKSYHALRNFIKSYFNVKLEK